jgi:antitoxin VapB
MSLNIKDPEAERLARMLAQQTGETIPLAIHRALDARNADEVIGYDESGLPG